MICATYRVMGRLLFGWRLNEFDPFKYDLKLNFSLAEVG